MSRAQLTSTVEQNSAGAASPFVAGKNKIINGDFGVWQRGTSFTPASTVTTYSADRFGSTRDGSGATVTVSQQAFTPGTAPVTGYEAQYFWRYAQTVAGTGGTYTNILETHLEDVKLLSGQTATFSFWAKADASRTATIYWNQIFGTGGSSTVYTNAGSVNLTTTWARYSVTFAVPSMSGKTIGTSSWAGPSIQLGANTVQTIDVWGVQLEAGSVATPFTTASGTVQGELSLCQRYYWRATSVGSSSAYQHFGMGQAYSSSAAKVPIFLPVSMRTAPSISFTGNLGLLNSNNTAVNNASVVTADGVSANIAGTYWTGSSGLSAGNAATLMANANNTCYIEFSSEL